MFYEALIELNSFLLNEEIVWNNLENSLILTEASILLREEDEEEYVGSSIADKTETMLRKFGGWLKGLFDKAMNFFTNFFNNVGEVFKGIKRALSDNKVREAIEQNKDWKKISITIPDTRGITNKLISNSVDLKTIKGIRILEDLLSNVPMLQLQRVIKNTSNLIALINATNKSKKYVLNLRNVVKQEIVQANNDLKKFKKGSEAGQAITKELSEKKTVLMRLVKISAKFATIVRTQYFTIFKFIKGLGKHKETKSKYSDLERDTGKTKKF